MGRIKITAQNGRYSIVERRSNPLPGGVQAISSTTLQPYMARNFSADGACVGGRTLTEMQREQIVAAAEKARCTIEES